MKLIESVPESIAVIAIVILTALFLCWIVERMINAPLWVIFLTKEEQTIYFQIRYVPGGGMYGEVIRDVCAKGGRGKFKRLLIEICEQANDNEEVITSIIGSDTLRAMKACNPEHRKTNHITLTR